MRDRGGGACVAGVCVCACVCGQGACMAGGVHGQGACMAGEMATAAGGMHPTGMHSCWVVLKIYDLWRPPSPMDRWLDWWIHVKSLKSNKS